MMKQLTCVVVLMLTAAALPGAVSSAPRLPGACGCRCEPLIDAHGSLNTKHCHAEQVLSVLDHYAQSTAHLLPERVGPAELDVLERQLHHRQREVVRALLALMTQEELERFLPFLINADRPGPGTGTTPGTWRGADRFVCHNAVYWINTGLDKIAAMDVILLNLQLETSMYLSNPSHFCNPSLLTGSMYYNNGLSRFAETRDWLQAAADHMSQGHPAVAAVASYIAWWRAFQGSLSFVIAHSVAPISGDDRCTEVADAGLVFAEVGGAARQAYEQADACAQGR